MAQSEREIKMKYTVSRNLIRRDLSKESKLTPAESVSVPQKSSRRQFFKSIVPASGKALTDILRAVGIDSSKKS